MSRSRILACLCVLLGLAACAKSKPESSSTHTAAQNTPDTTASAPRAAYNIFVHPADAFYDPPANLPTERGALLRSEVMRGAILPNGMRGWRILYTTSIDDKTPATAVACVFAPLEAPAASRPVIAWAHGTTGLLQKCMPSLVSVPSEGIPARGRIVGNGWVVVATDYAFAEKDGPHPYLIGEGEARSVLDAVRAAHHMPELNLDQRTVVWGHSQGGHTALWAGSIGPRYAPDVKIVGVAAIAPAADILNIIKLNPAVDKRLGPYIARSYSRFYPDIKFEQAVRPAALDAAQKIVNLCGFAPPEDPREINALAGSFDGGVLAIDTNPALVKRLEENKATGAIAAPLLIAQGLADIVVPAAVTNAYVDERCAAGQRLEYWTFAGLDHTSIVHFDSALGNLLATWTEARFADKPQDAGCARSAY